MRGNGGGNGGQRRNSGSNYQQRGDGRPYNSSHNDGSQGGNFDQAYYADQSHYNVDRTALPPHMQQWGRQGANPQQMDRQPQNRSPSDVDTQSGDNSDH